MRRTTFLGILAIALSVGASCAQEPATEEAPTEVTAMGPKIVCEEPMYDFGSRDPSETVEHAFVLRNDGDQTLEIRNVRTSCGCTVANVGSKSLKPTETTEVVAKLNLKNRRGRQHKTVTVESNDPKSPRFSLGLRGEAVSAVVLQPERLHWAQVDENEGAEGSILVTAREGATLEISKVESHADMLEAELETLEAGSRYKVRIATKNPMKRGSFRGYVRMHTNLPNTPTVDIHVTGVVLDELTIAPEKIVLTYKQDAVTRYVVVRPGKTKVFKVESVETPVEEMTAHIVELPRNTGYQIRLENVKASKELDGKNLKITTDVEGREEIEIPFQVVGSPS